SFPMLLYLLLFAPAVGNINVSDVRQKVEGFGGSIAYYASYLTHHPYKQEIYAALFDPQEGLGVSLLRLQNYYRGQSGGNFDPDAAEVVATASQIRGKAIPVLLTSWSPPAYLKSNGAEGCPNTNDCTLAKVNGAYDYDGFAQYWLQSIL